jgi:hypothetical protein
LKYFSSIAKKILIYGLAVLLIFDFLFVSPGTKIKAQTTITGATTSQSGSYPANSFTVDFSTASDNSMQLAFSWSLPAQTPSGSLNGSTINTGSSPGNFGWSLNLYDDTKNTHPLIPAEFPHDSNKANGMIAGWPAGANWKAYSSEDRVIESGGSLTWGDKFRAILSLYIGDTYGPVGSPIGQTTLSFTAPTGPSVITGSGSGNCPVTAQATVQNGVNSSAQNGSGQHYINFSWKFNTASQCSNWQHYVAIFYGTFQTGRLATYCTQPTDTNCIAGESSRVSVGTSGSYQVKNNGSWWPQEGTYTIYTSDGTSAEKITNTSHFNGSYTINVTFSQNGITSSNGQITNNGGVNNGAAGTGGTQCTNNCGLWKLGVVGNAICQAQCFIIDGLAGLITWVINSVLYPALGLSSSGGSTTTTTTTPPTNQAGGAPKKIGNVTVSGDANSITLSWPAVSGAANYKISNITTSGWVTLATQAGTTYTDSNVASGQTYNFTIQSLDSSGKQINTSGSSFNASVTKTATGIQ